MILGFYLASRGEARRDPNVSILLVILSIDAFRTVFESAYFGLYFNSLYGFLSPSIAVELAKPSMVLVPKLINVLAGFVVLFILIRNWLPRAIREKRASDDALQLAATVFTHAEEGIVIASPKGVTLDVNGAFLAMSGYTRAELIGSKLGIHRSKEHSNSFYAGIWRAAQDEGSWLGVIWNRNKSGMVYPVQMSATAVRGPAGDIVSFVCLYTNVAEAVEQQRQLDHMAHFDVLTGLPNRTLLSDRLSQALLQCVSREQSVGVLFVDLDDFKKINDRYGRGAADRLLLEVSSNMKAALRSVDTLARFGGDEFVAVLPKLENHTQCESILAQLLEAVRRPVDIDGDKVTPSASIGVTLYPEDSADPEQLIRHADQAMYLAKVKDKGSWQYFDTLRYAAFQEQSRLQDSIRSALVDGGFVLHFQPVIELVTHDFVGVEALIRWPSEEGNLLEPEAFLGATQNNALAVDLGDWVFETALSQIEAWSQQGLNICVNVNVDGFHLQQPGFAARLAELLARHPLVDPANLELEVLETSALDNLEKVASVMTECTGLGVSFAIDDFGTGYSSLTYLRRLPAQRIKIDQTFVRGMLDDASDMSIVQGVIGLGHSFKRKIVAEGVESEAHCQALLSLGCELGQGYGIARPMPPDALPKWLDDWKKAQH
ncbi:EAL domain-containing protein [Congregibacter variabilis]|uniref:EAL domain-containing protein n=1 Tax=Congregibacter variabilis TaxID=3081200 RepID=A0ABZ0I6N1_9GAMM|nr:EAL domain-containing protein [Congregibacter sp. IMCC43200]